MRSGKIAVLGFFCSEREREREREEFCTEILHLKK